MYTTIQYHLFFNNFILTENVKKISNPAALFIYGVSFNTATIYISCTNAMLLCNATRASRMRCKIHIWSINADRPLLMIETLALYP